MHHCCLKTGIITCGQYPWKLELSPVDSTPGNWNYHLWTVPLKTGILTCGQYPWKLELSPVDSTPGMSVLVPPLVHRPELSTPIPSSCRRYFSTCFGPRSKQNKVLLLYTGVPQARRTRIRQRLLLVLIHKNIEYHRNM